MPAQGASTVAMNRVTGISFGAVLGVDQRYSGGGNPRNRRLRSGQPQCSARPRTLGSWGTRRCGCSGAPHHAAVHLRPAACRRTFRCVSVVVEGAGPPGHHLFGCGQARTLLMAVPPGAVVVIAVAVVIVVGGSGGPLFEHGHTVPPEINK